jgi:ketopantoate reductase
MARTAVGGVGILPAGALGVSFFYHLTQQLRHIDDQVFFLERNGSASAKALRAHGECCVADDTGVHYLTTAGIFKSDLLGCFNAGCLPEVLLVCPNPDQLTGVIGNLVNLLEQTHQVGQLTSLWPLPFPIVVLCSNGIYFQRLRFLFLEKLEESVLFGRLPDLWPDLMPRIVSRILRGVTLQTGIREGSGGAAVFRPGPRGITRIAGGDPVIRQRCCQLLEERDGWFEQADNDSATHLEFDKAMTNLSTNLLGQIYGIDEEGRFTPLTIRDMLHGRQAEEIRELCGWVFRTGQAVKAYGAEDDFEVRFRVCMENLRLHQEHIPSSVQWIGLHYAAGTLEPKLAPTEAWLLGPLIRYARGANQEDAARYLEGLKCRLLEKLQRAASRQDRVIADQPVVR